MKKERKSNRTLNPGDISINVGNELLSDDAFLSDVLGGPKSVKFSKKRHSHLDGSETTPSGESKPLSLPNIENNVPFKKFIDISLVNQKLRKGFNKSEVKPTFRSKAFSYE